MNLWEGTVVEALSLNREKDNMKKSKYSAISKKFIKNFKKYWGLYLLLLPTLIYVLIYHYYPMYGVQIAFRDFSP